MNKKSIQLKPCPVCGKNAVICFPVEGIVGYVVRCSEVGCFELIESYDLDFLIERWNSLVRKGV